MLGNSLSSTQGALGMCVFHFSLFFKCNFALCASASLDRGGVFNQIYHSSWINLPERPYHFRPPQALSHSVVDDETHTHAQSKDIYGWLEAVKMRCWTLAGTLQCTMVFFFSSLTLVAGQCHTRHTAYRAPTHSLPLIGLIGYDQCRSCDVMWCSRVPALYMCQPFSRSFSTPKAPTVKSVSSSSCVLRSYISSGLESTASHTPGYSNYPVHTDKWLIFTGIFVIKSVGYDEFMI